jgi:hypothetical protein
MHTSAPRLNHTVSGTPEAGTRTHPSCALRSPRTRCRNGKSFPTSSPPTPCALSAPCAPPGTPGGGSSPGKPPSPELFVFSTCSRSCSRSCSRPCSSSPSLGVDAADSKRASACRRCGVTRMLKGSSAARNSETSVP